ncbi:MAG TPA: hypothetical protein VIX15_15260 [Streptosporangiaceae bacterium]
MTDPSGGLPRRAAPLRQRRVDWVLLAFFTATIARMAQAHPFARPVALALASAAGAAGPAAAGPAAA